MFRFYTRKRRIGPAPDFLRRIARTSALLALCFLYWQPSATAHDLEGSVFLMSWDGASVKRISVVDSTDTPCWMPDGRSVLYVAHTRSESAFHLVSTSGEKLLSVPVPSPIVTVGGVSISPDGTEVAFAGGTAESEGTFDIYGMKLETEKPEWRRIVSDGILPFWSPDGRHLAFTSFREGNLDVFVADRDGGNLRNLTRHKGYDARGTWSPDGDSLAFETNRFGNIEICIVEVASGEVVRITDHPGEDREPDWSRQGIAFASNRDGPFRIYCMASDGTGVRPLTPGNYDRQPVWSPNSDSLCFISRMPPLPDALGE